jgi:hypothetical protein
MGGGNKSLKMNKLEKTQNQYIAPESVVKELIMSKTLLQGSIADWGQDPEEFG